MSDTNQALIRTEDSPQTLMRRATDVAGVCKEIVTKTALNIQGHRYVRVEGWEAIATAHGCVAGARDVEKIEGGYRAVGEVRRSDTGAVIATAEGFLGDDEKMWASRPEYARRAMAQTRAISRVCRSCFAHVVVLIDSNLSTTPAEEVPQDGFRDVPQQPPPPAGDKGTAKLVGVEEFTGTNQKTGKPWKRWGLTLEDANGQQLKLGTFDTKLGELSMTLKGMPVLVSFKPGKKEGTFDLTSIAEASDELPM